MTIYRDFLNLNTLFIYSMHKKKLSWPPVWPFRLLHLTMYENISHLPLNSLWCPNSKSLHQVSKSNFHIYKHQNGSPMGCGDEGTAILKRTCILQSSPSYSSHLYSQDKILLNRKLCDPESSECGYTETYLFKARTVKPAKTTIAKEQLCKHVHC